MNFERVRTEKRFLRRESRDRSVGKFDLKCIYNWECCGGCNISRLGPIVTKLEIDTNSDVHFHNMYTVLLQNSYKYEIWVWVEKWHKTALGPGFEA